TDSNISHCCLFARSRVSFSTFQILTCERSSSDDPYRFFSRRAPPATPRMRPEVRPKKLTRRSASPSGNVFRMMASVSRAGMNCRRADSGSPFTRQSALRTRKCELEFLSQARALRNLCAAFLKNFLANPKETRRILQIHLAHEFC